MKSPKTAKLYSLFCFPSAVALLSVNVRCCYSKSVEQPRYGKQACKRLVGQSRQACTFAYQKRYWTDGLMYRRNDNTSERLTYLICFSWVRLPLAYSLPARFVYLEYYTT